MSKFSNILLLSAFFIVMDLQEARAYLDPGTGSYVFQVAIAFLLVALAAFKNFWRMILDNVKKLIGFKREHAREPNPRLKDK